ncbi:hypothetical protein [Peribacillus simplex]|uniref:hypothetical protein n=1 Tax=Peribacillus TaxID=2675229 RepID=UPI0036D875C8
MCELNADINIVDLRRITLGVIGPIGGVEHIGSVGHVGSIGHVSPVGSIGYGGPIGDYVGIGISYGFPFAGELAGGAFLSEPFYDGIGEYGYPGYAPYPDFFSYYTF